MQNVHDSQAGVESNEVRQSQRTHGNVGPILHDVVNVLATTNTGLKADDGLVDIRHQDAVGEETRRVSRYGRDFTHTLHKRNSRVDGLLGSLQTSNNLHSLLDGHRIHEVRRDHARRGLQISGVRRGGSGDFSDRDGRSVCREDGVLGSNLRELGEDGGLEVYDFRNGLDHKVHRGEVVHLQTGGDAGADAVCRIAGDTLLGDILLKKLICKATMCYSTLHVSLVHRAVHRYRQI